MMLHTIRCLDVKAYVAMDLASSTKRFSADSANPQDQLAWPQNTGRQQQLAAFFVGSFHRSHELQIWVSGACVAAASDRAREAHLCLLNGVGPFPKQRCPENGILEHVRRTW